MFNETHRASPRYKISDFFSSLLESLFALSSRHDHLPDTNHADLAAQRSSASNRLAMNDHGSHQTPCQEQLGEERFWIAQISPAASKTGVTRSMIASLTNSH
jgi:hypothetical protein